ncbi:MAG: HEPN domain-containing protein [Candidatus Aminicenantes bacterium]|nr:HEPN domain-containing protein [Candidatus Aminicenantes bacterium]
MHRPLIGCGRRPPFERTHEIGELITDCESKDTKIAALKEEADTLTDYAVSLRYPDDLYVPTIDEAKEAYQLARKIKNYVLKKIELL